MASTADLEGAGAKGRNAKCDSFSLITDRLSIRVGPLVTPNLGLRCGQCTTHTLPSSWVMHPDLGPYETPPFQFPMLYESLSARAKFMV